MKIFFHHKFKHESDVLRRQLSWDWMELILTLNSKEGMASKDVQKPLLIVQNKQRQIFTEYVK